MPLQINDPCAGEVLDPVCDPCLNEIEHGRVRGVAFIHKSYLATLIAGIANAQTWTDGINGKAIFVIPETIGSFDGGAPVEGTGYGDASNRLIGYNFTLNFKDPSFEGNYPFYNSISQSSGWCIAWRTETLTRISAKQVNIVPKSPVAEDLNSEVVWDVEVKWVQKNQPQIFTTPANVFVCAE